MKYLFALSILVCSMDIKAQSRKDLIGCWTMPALKDENLSLDSEGGFFFNDYQEYRRAFEPVFGTWKLKGNVLILSYEENKQMRFQVVMTETGGWMLSKSRSLRLFKARPEDCEK